MVHTTLDFTTDTRFVEIGREGKMAALTPIVAAWIQANPGRAKEVKVQQDRHTRELVAYVFDKLDAERKLGGSLARDRSEGELARQAAHEMALLNPEDEGMSEADSELTRELNPDIVGKKLWIGKAFKTSKEAYEYAKLAVAATGRSYTVKNDRAADEWVVITKTYVEGNTDALIEALGATRA